LIQYTPYCQNCPHQALNTCPLNDWQKRHPEFVNDELSQKIEALSKEKVYY
jgi:predicted xylose isomerase-like sugar epimerase